MPIPLPFDAALPDGDARTAFLLLALDPRLGGLVLRGPRGLGKSQRLASFVHFLNSTMGEHRIQWLPRNVDDAGLSGSLELELTLKQGRPVRSSGLLERSRGGWIVLDPGDRLEARTASTLKRFLEVEAPGTRLLAAGEFAVLPSWLDVVPMVIELGTEEGTGVLETRWRFDLDPLEFSRSRADAHRALFDLIVHGRERLAKLEPTLAFMEALAHLSTRLDLEGARSDIFAACVARAHAALRGASRIEEEDLEFAVRVVFEPRASAKTHEAKRSSAASTAANGDTADLEGNAAARGGGAPEGPPDRVHDVKPIAGLGDLARWLVAEGRSRGRGGELFGRRPCGARPARSRGIGRRLALGETLRRAALASFERQPPKGRALEIRPQDLVFRVVHQRMGTLLLLLVDASGSMAMHRMGEAKGAVLSVLERAYVTRDTVGLVAFRNASAEVILPPTGSIERARRSLEVLPTGGGTPLAAGLQEVVRMARHERRQRNRPLLVLCITDGHANVPLEGESGRAIAQAELEVLAGPYHAARIPTVVIDTSLPYAPDPQGQRLARLLGAAWLPLPRALGQAFSPHVAEDP